MDKEVLYNKVMHILDEVELSNNFYIGNNIELLERFNALLSGTLSEIIRVVPLSYLKAIEIPGDPVIKQDGSGEMLLPDNFFKLAAFKMNSWKRTVYSAINESSPLYNLQFSAATRGGVNKPVVAVLPGNILLFWSVPPFCRTHICERKEYIPNASYLIAESSIDIDERLENLLAWRLARDVMVSFKANTQVIDNKIKEIESTL